MRYDGLVKYLLIIHIDYIKSLLCTGLTEIDYGEEVRFFNAAFFFEALIGFPGEFESPLVEACLLQSRTGVNGSGCHGAFVNV